MEIQNRKRNRSAASANHPKNAGNIISTYFATVGCRLATNIHHLNLLLKFSFILLHSSTYNKGVRTKKIKGVKTKSESIWHIWFFTVLRSHIVNHFSFCLDIFRFSQLDAHSSWERGFFGYPGGCPPPCFAERHFQGRKNRKMVVVSLPSSTNNSLALSNSRKKTGNCQKTALTLLKLFGTLVGKDTERTAIFISDWKDVPHPWPFDVFLL